MSRLLDHLRLEPLAQPSDARHSEAATAAPVAPTVVAAPAKAVASTTPSPTPRSERHTKPGLLLTGLLGLLVGIGATLLLSPTAIQPLPYRPATAPQPTSLPTPPATATPTVPSAPTPTNTLPSPHPTLPNPDNPPRLRPHAVLTGGAPPEDKVAISRGQPKSAASSPLVAAWQAQRDNKNAEAEALYKQVLTRDARNVDALNGLAALAQDRGDAVAAAALYRRVLALQPNNAYALAALAQLRGGNDVDEAAVRQRAEHDAPHAYALANRLAAAGRWREAQAWYFQAYSRDADEADYAYNLAVSLDMLGQTGPAADYYRRALALAGQRSGRFDAATVEARLAELAGAAP